jgi:hypothetical protein
MAHLAFGFVEICGRLSKARGTGCEQAEEKRAGELFQHCV